MNELELAPRPELAVAKRAPDIADMLQAVVEKGITADNVGALERLADLYEKMQAKKAEQEFNAAFNALQAETPDIVATTEIPNRGKYERFEDVMRVVKPLLIKNGFSVAFEQFADDKRIKVTCHLRHVGGHSSSTPFAVRLGGRADSDTQADCKASTTAKRNSLLQALNIVIRQDCMTNEDNDATLEGNPNEFVTQDQADELERRAKDVNANIPAFMRVAGATKFSEIPANKYDELDRMLRLKETRGK